MQYVLYASLLYVICICKVNFLPVYGIGENPYNIYSFLSSYKSSQTVPLLFTIGRKLIFFFL